MTDIAFQEFQKLKECLDKDLKILLVVHRRPDGDALGSACALAGYLKKRGAKFVIYSKTPIPPDFEFLPFTHFVTSEKEIWNAGWELIITLDSSSLKYAGVDDEVAALKLRPFLINIDHHASNNLFGDLNIVNHSAASTTEIIYAFFREMKIPLDSEIATCLLNGMMTDTSTFHTPNTTASVIEASSRLLAHGAKFRDIARHIIFNKNLAVLKLWGKALSRLSMNNPWNIAVTFIAQNDFVESGLTEDHSSGLATFLNSLDARAVLVLTEQNDGTLKGSLRTTHDDIDVMKLAKFFGGGGHKKAAGFLVQGRLEETPEGFHIV